MRIDYTPITSTTRYEKEAKVIQIKGKKIGVVLLVIVALAYLLPALATVAGVGLVIYVLFKLPAARKMSKERQTAVEAFASKNGFQLSGKFGMRKVHTQPNSAPGGLPIIDLPYRIDRFEQIVKMAGTLSHGRQFEFSNYRFERKSPHKNKRYTSRSIIMKVLLDIDLPRLYVNSKHDDILDPSKPTTLDDMQQVRLEGEFPKHFDVYYEQGDQIDVLHILSPDVMHALMENRLFDVWIHENAIYLFRRGTEIEYFVSIPHIFPTMQLLLHEIDMIRRNREKTAKIPTTSPGQTIRPSSSAA